MKCLYGVLTCICLALGVRGQYQPVDQGSSVQFKVKNFGFGVTGSFSRLQGHITFDPKDLGAASFDASVEAASINTGNDMRDNHLREDSYFDVKNHPRIQFVSTRVTTSN
ncbi:MAG TPA: YceI family protein, partial [Puia sp.]|nr:YceI family protein [Puia sp.]